MSQPGTSVAGTTGDTARTATTNDDISVRLGVSIDALAAVCRRWNIAEMALFGSVLRSDFRPDSDVDVLVTFAPDAALSVFDLVALQEELELLLGRSVDIVEEKAVRNPFRRREILGTRRGIYASADAD